MKKIISIPLLILMILSCASLVLSNDINSDMMTYYKLDDKLDSVSGEDFVIQTNVVLNSTHGKIGSGAYFYDSTSSKRYMETNFITNSSLTASQNFSTGIWFKSLDTTPKTRSLFTTQSQATTYPFFEGVQIVTTGYLKFRVATSVLDEISIIYPVDIADGQWHHMLYVHDVENSQSRLYYDGVLVNDTLGVLTSGTIIDSTTHHSLGTPDNDGLIARQWYGNLDEWFISKRAYNDTEAYQIYSSTQSYPFATTPEYYAFDTDGGINYETFGVTYNGTITGGVYYNQTSAFDSCTGDVLREYYINSNNVLYTDYDCVSNGYDACTLGECVYINYTYSGDTDGGSYVLQGTAYNGTTYAGVSVNITESTDSCLNSSHLTEYYLDGNDVKSVTLSCDSIGYDECINGQCQDFAISYYAYDTDYGINYTGFGLTYSGYIDGGVKYNTSVAFDSCDSAVVLREYYLDGLNVLATTQDCTAINYTGCVSGECTLTLLPCTFNVPPDVEECDDLNQGRLNLTNACTEDDIIACQNAFIYGGGDLITTQTGLPQILGQLQLNIKLIFGLILIAGVVFITSQKVQNPVVLIFVGILATILVVVMGLIEVKILIIILVVLALLLLLGMTIFKPKE